MDFKSSVVSLSSVDAGEQAKVSADQFLHVRKHTEALAMPLSEADAQLQSMPDASPAKWHLAHTTWFFETFILCQFVKSYTRVNDNYNYLFNSYYNGIGEQYSRAHRGLISRPSLNEVMDYRKAIDSAMCDFITSLDVTPAIRDSVNDLIVLGLNHEQQHQELLVTDIKHAFFQNPLLPSYDCAIQALFDNDVDDTQTAEWLSIDSGLYEVGHSGNEFCFDNERPAHKVYVNACEIMSRLVANQEFLVFVEQGGYQNPDYWHADGWAWVQSNNVESPLYWTQKEGEWFEYTLRGLEALKPNQVAMHINYYEASAYANWLGLRLPTEFEWESAVKNVLASSAQDSSQWFDRVWQWTTSSYGAYPGFMPFEGVAGEYNGKFMSNQYVLRGSSCATPAGHKRLTYRNFFYAHQSWQFTGIRLAR